VVITHNIYRLMARILQIWAKNEEEDNVQVGYLPGDPGLAVNFVEHAPISCPARPPAALIVYPANSSQAFRFLHERPPENGVRKPWRKIYNTRYAAR